MAKLRRETFRVLFLDAANRVIDDRTMWTGTVDAVQVHPREIVRDAVMLDAAAVILTHNHPSSDAQPTDSDLVTTEQVQAACAAVGVAVHDHLIVSRTQVCSLRQGGWMKPVELAR